MKVYSNYYPITATPFQRNKEYTELAPCDELKPYIRCFWGTEAPIKRQKHEILTTGMVIPDTCVDIMFFVNYTKNEISSSFCGIDDVVFYTNSWNDTGDNLMGLLGNSFLSSSTSVSAEIPPTLFASVGHVEKKFRRVRQKRTVLFEMSDT